jgi:ATP-dependent helicase HrpB
VRQEARAWEKAVGRQARESRGDACASAGLLLALAYPDRIAQRRAGQAGRFLLRNGIGAFTEAPSLLLADWIVAAELDGDRRESRLWLAAPVTLAELLPVFGDQVESEAIVAWDDGEDGVVAVRRERLGAIVLREVPLREPDPARISEAVIAWIGRAGLGVLPWCASAHTLRCRLRFLSGLPGGAESPIGWPDVSDAGLLTTMREWLAPYLGAVRRRADLAGIDLTAALLGLLDWRRRQALDQLAPTHLQVPSGSRIALRYDDPANPTLSVRLQEVFGLTETPRIAGGRVPVTLELLSPARRTVQVTRDLSGFWRTSYFDVRKDLRGRYPKHDWPEDPLSAAPRRGSRPRP